jgi:hypothetical protein
VRAALQVARAIIVVFFQPEGVDGQAGGRADGAALDATLASTRLTAFFWISDPHHEKFL